MKWEFRNYSCGEGYENKLTGMLSKISSLMLVGLLLAAGCSSTNFTEYRGPSLAQGTGGTVRTVDGIDFWENGNPNRKFKVLGVIDDERGDRWFAGSSRDKALASMAKSRSGSAIILMGSKSQLVGINQHGNVLHSVKTKVMVVKYED